MRSRNLLVVSSITATLLTGLWLKPKQPRAEAEAVFSEPGIAEPVVISPVVLPAQDSQPKTKDGRQYPLVPAEPAELATLLAAIEQALRDPATAAEALPDLGHQQQVIYRVLSTDQPRSQQVIKALPPRWRSVAERHLAARREFVRMSRGLWGYNNSDYYGRAVLLYASLMKEDPAAYTGLYHWEIHFNAAAGDLWLPVGYNQPQRITVEQHLQANPASRSPNG